MSLSHTYSKIALLAVIILSLLQFLPVDAGNDLLATDWRVDDPSIYGNTAFYTYIAALNQVTNDPGNAVFTTGWLGLNLDHQCTDFGIGCGPGEGGDQFSQVGTMTQNGTTFWFVYAELGVQCL